MAIGLFFDRIIFCKIIYIVWTIFNNFTRQIQCEHTIKGTTFRADEPCGEHGSTSLGIFETTNQNKIKCGTRCMEEETCVAFNHGKETTRRFLCELTSMILEDTCVGVIFRPNIRYYELVSSVGFLPVSPPGNSPSNPINSCQDLTEYEADSGTYWLSLNGNTFQVFCDMDTDGGGWTLVWGYTFTNYDQFDSPDNAITPQPNYVPEPPESPATPVSTIPPNSNSTTGAFDIALWPSIGETFLIKSNINHWIKCSPAGGSLVTNTKGTVSCEMVKPISSLCNTLDLSNAQVFSTGNGVYLKFSNDFSKVMYFWNYKIGVGWPIHDPCGTSQSNQIQGVTYPMGQIFLRFD